ncbi:hypothetical protein VMCG_01164 [Cytospora schulzeri]|uniref:Uncharacterized protein n=1 Tax=Cytospora schulzeri TaxID=448051 RepID=A0A423X6G4_9PEZI|nr:hypothetical protein VMCG_01164 [Valsa malicola]
MADRPGQTIQPADNCLSYDWGVHPAVFAARAVGRSPEEHEKLERMLAARRARGTSSPAVAYVRRRMNGSGDVAAEQEELRRQQEQEQRQLEVPRQGGRAEEEEIARFRASAAPQRQCDHRPSSSPLRQALDGSAAQRRTALLAPFGFTRGRPAKGYARGAGWHRRGWRDMGEMWIDVKIGSEYTEGQDVDEDLTMEGFVEQVQIDFQERTDYRPKGEQTWDLLFRMKCLRKILVDTEAQGLRGADVLVRDLFDGGETVDYQVYNEHGVKLLPSNY